MSIQMRYGEEQAEVELGDQNTLMKAMKVAATKQFGLYMEDFEFRVEGRLVVDPEDFDPENDVFEIVEKSGQIDFTQLYETLVGKANEYYHYASEQLKTPEFKEHFGAAIQEILGLLKKLALAFLESVKEQDPDQLVQLLNAGIQLFTDQKAYLTPHALSEYVAQLEGKLQQAE